MKRLCVPMVTALLALSCATEIIREDATEKDYRDGGRELSRRLVQTIDEHNARTLSSYAVSFTIDGKAGSKSFKALGNALYSREPRLMNITFNDFYFRTTIGRLFQEGDQIGMYFPMEKKLVIDTAQGINLRNYTDMGLDYGIIMGLATGSIPLVPGYRVKQGLEATDGSESLLIVENRDSQQAIAFKGAVPIRMALVDRRSRERVEFFLKEPVQQGPASFYRKITVMAGHASMQLQISFTTISVNVPVKVPLLKDLKLPSNVTVIRF